MSESPNPTTKSSSIFPVSKPTRRPPADQQLPQVRRDRPLTRLPSQTHSTPSSPSHALALHRLRGIILVQILHHISETEEEYLRLRQRRIKVDLDNVRESSYGEWR